MEKTYKILKLVLFALCFAALLLGANLLYQNLSRTMETETLATQPVPEATEETLTPAPDFTVVDAQGNSHSLSDFRGKPVVLNFWASRCGPCQREMPDFEAAWETHGEEVHFLMVNLTDGHQETVESAGEFLAEKGYSFPVYFDTNQEAAYAYGVNAVPVTYFIDSDGNFVAWRQGMLDAATLQTGIDLLLETK